MPMTEERNRWDFLVYTDGACIGNPGPGGWGVVVISRDGAQVEKSGGCRATTNNRMELTAAIEGLRATPAGARVLLRSDSQLLVKTINAGWKRNANRDLWDVLDQERIARNVLFEWVKGHDVDPHNARADTLAIEAAKSASHWDAAGSGYGMAPDSPRTLRPVATPPLSRPHGRVAPCWPRSDEGQSEARQSARAILRDGETIARCSQCGREFVRRSSDHHEPVCSLVACQMAARQRR